MAAAAAAGEPVLDQLTPLTKERYREHFMWDPECLADAALVSHTTGTTGQVTWRHRTQREAAVIAHLFGRGETTQGQSPFGIAIRYHRHGMEMPMPGRSTMVAVSLSEDVDLHQIVELLEVGAVLHGVRRHPEILAGGGMDVALIAHALVSCGMTEPAARIKQVFVGGHLPAAIRASISTALPNAAISSHYSLAEVFGGASATADGSEYLTEAHVIAEVLDEDGAPTPEGSLGELAFTEVFPFVQAQPLVRYLTGDIVERLPNDEAWRVRFRWWGRSAHSMRDASGWVLGEGPLTDALLSEPLVARVAHRGHLAASVPSVGSPMAELRDGPDGCPILIIGVRRDPWQLGSDLDPFLDRLRRILRAGAKPGAVLLRLHQSSDGQIAAQLREVPDGRDLRL